MQRPCLSEEMLVVGFLLVAFFIVFILALFLPLNISLFFLKIKEPIFFFLSPFSLTLFQISNDKYLYLLPKWFMILLLKYFINTLGLHGTTVYLLKKTELA